MCSRPVLNPGFRGSDFSETHARVHATLFYLKEVGNITPTSVHRYKKKIMSAVKGWCFTLNNPEGLLEFDPSWMTALVYQEEVGAQGTHHLQGYVETVNRVRMQQVKDLFGENTMFLEPRRGTRAQAIEYCRKEPRVGGPYEFGNLAVAGQGRRTELHEFMEAVNAGVSFSETFDAFPNVHARFPQFVRDSFERHREAALPPPQLELRPGWQTTLATRLAGDPDPRKVLWYTDRVGNTGKSYFAHHLSPAPYVVTGGKQADILYAYAFQKVVIFDWPRHAEDRFPYQIVEFFKNGYFLNTKYQSRPVRFEIPHVVVFSNSGPDLNSLSLDRWDITDII